LNDKDFGTKGKEFSGIAEKKYIRLNMTVFSVDYGKSKLLNLKEG